MEEPNWGGGGGGGGGGGAEKAHKFKERKGGKEIFYKQYQLCVIKYEL